MSIDARHDDVHLGRIIGGRQSEVGRANNGYRVGFAAHVFEKRRFGVESPVGVDADAQAVRANGAGEASQVSRRISGVLRRQMQKVFPQRLGRLGHDAVARGAGIGSHIQFRLDTAQAMRALPIRACRRCRRDPLFVGQYARRIADQQLNLGRRALFERLPDRLQSRQE